MRPARRHLFPEWFYAEPREKNSTAPRVLDVGCGRPLSGKLGSFRPRKPLFADAQLGNTILVIGQNAHTQELRFLSRLSGGSSLRFAFLSRWADWSISIWPDRFDFRLTEKKTSAQLTKADIAKIIYLGPPEFPESRDSDRDIVIIEYSSILFSVMALCDPDSYSRMEAVYSGQSDEEVNDDEISTWNALYRLISLNISWREAFCEPGRVQILCADGSVISKETRLPVAQSSLWLLRLQNGRILPLYATVPPWIHSLSPKGQDVSGRLLPTNEGTAFVRTPRPNQEPTILLLGESTDAILNQISRVAPLVGARVKFLNQADAYKMPPGSFDQQVLKSDIVVNRLSHSQLHTEARYKHFRILRILEKSSKLILNRPSGGATNFSRSVNLMQLKTLGWRIPKTVATNDPDAAHNFIQNCGARTVCKPCSALRADVSMLTMKAVDRLERVANCPVVFQKYVAGNEYRIHSTSTESLAIEISKRAFRFNRHASFSVARLVTSLQVSRLCQNTTSSLGLVLAGIDVRKEKDTGNLFGLECNSMPAFTAFGRLHSIDVMRSILNLETNDPVPRSEINLAAG